MKEIVVISGKGGTGKTSVVGSFAFLAKEKVMVDCDVDAPDLHLLLHNPQVEQQYDFWGGEVASIDANACTQCGLCEECCRFDAIHGYEVDKLACEGCGLCNHVCPEKAISMNRCLSGHWFISKTEYGPLVHARLNPGQEHSGRLVAAIRRQASILAHASGFPLILTDGPPGIGCTVISSLAGASLALIVTEPSPAGIHDLKRICGVCRHFKIPAAVCINKYDLNEEKSRLIEFYCRNETIPMLGRIPFDDAVTHSIAQRTPLVEYSMGTASQRIQELWQMLSSMELAEV